FDFSLHAARPIALNVAYLGASFHGFAAQESDAVETIESHLFRALTTARLIPDRKTCAWSRCGRTDKGVSSFGQVVGLYIRSTRPRGAPGTVEWGPKPAWDGLPYLAMLNRILPREIRVLAWCPVPATFDARFDCSFRRYKYFFAADGLDIQAMVRAARKYVGRHDYRNFCKVDPSKGAVASTIGTTTSYPPSSASPALPSTFHVFVVKGHAFLWHQVRCMVAILFLIGRGLEPPETVDALLDMSRHPPDAGRPAYDMAPEAPLVLVECGFPRGLLRWR
ncbi:pseudouridine synthase, partial [Blyttiomyces helicus]